MGSGEELVPNKCELQCVCVLRISISLGVDPESDHEVRGVPETHCMK